MLAIGNFYIDKKNKKLLRNIDDNQEVKIDKQAVELLIFLSENQQNLLNADQLCDAIWPEQDKQKQRQEIPQMVRVINEIFQGNMTPAVITDVISVITDVTDQHYYLINHPCFEYNYTPITLTEMKQKLAQEQVKIIKQQQAKQQHQHQHKVNSVEQSAKNNTSTGQKILYSTILALLIIGFFAVTR